MSRGVRGMWGISRLTCLGLLYHVKSLSIREWCRVWWFHRAENESELVSFGWPVVIILLIIITLSFGAVRDRSFCR